MPILSFTMEPAGQTQIIPRLIRIQTDDTLSKITTLNYVAGITSSGYQFRTDDICYVSYLDSDNISKTDRYHPSITSSGITLVADIGDSVTLPVVDGDFAVFDGTTGIIKDAGYLPSSSSKTRVVMANGATIANHLAAYTDITGTVGIDAATAINAGNLQAGLTTGTAGSFISCPGTTTTGTFSLTAVASSGNYAAVLSNAALGQATTWTIPDPVAATAKIVVAPSALVSGNLVKASGTAGLVVDGGAKIISGTTGAYAGGGTSNAFTVTGLTSAAVGSAVIRASTNAVSIAKALPGTDSLTITFSADPGASTTVDYIYTTAALT